MIYNKTPVKDYNNILRYINSFATKSKIDYVEIETNALWGAVNGYTRDFPYVGGAEKASPFKKAAYFVVWFLATSPIKSPILKEGNELYKFNPNAVIAVDIALYTLEDSILMRNDATEAKISSPISLSDHSYIDLLMVLNKGITPAYHFNLLSLYFEQLVYKTNRHCEYLGGKYYPELMDDDVD